MLTVVRVALLAVLPVLCAWSWSGCPSLWDWFRQ